MRRTGYRIAWKSKITGFQDQGSSLTKKDAESGVRRANSHWLEINHWVERFCPFTLIWEKL